MLITKDIQINVKLFGDKQCRCKEVDCRLYQELHSLFLVLAIISLGKSQMVALLNPFIPNVFSHHYQLDESISNFRVVGWYFSFLYNF